jgi:uncharacterized membrane protein
MNAFVMIGFLLWILAAIVTPWLERRCGWSGLAAGLHAIVAIQSVMIGGILLLTHDVVDVARIVVTIVFCGFAVEFFGTRHRLPFGEFAYSDKLRPQLAGIPLLVACAYFPVVVTSWGIADLLSSGSRSTGFFVTAAVAATFWDLLIDPLMVGWKVWNWDKKGGYFGIPWSNSWGWFSVTLAISVLSLPGSLAAVDLASIYSAAWIMNILAVGIAWPHRGPAIVGGLAMGSLIVAAWFRHFSA